MIAPLVLAAALEALFANVWPPAPAPEPPPPVQTSLTPARASDCDRAGPGNIFGETAYVRAESGLPELSEDLRRAAAAARAAQDAGAARGFLAPFIADVSDPIARQARILLAYEFLRTDGAAQAAEVHALLSPEAAFEDLSDAHYIRAVLASAEGRREAALAALDRALEINPRFYNAVVMRALLQVRAADARFRSAGACAPMVDAVAEAVVPVAALGACPLQLAHFGLALDRALPPSGSARRVTSRQTVDLALAFAARKDVLHARLLDQPPPLCRQEIARHDFGNPPQ